MKSYSQFIAELFNKKAKWSWGLEAQNTLDAIFIVGENDEVYTSFHKKPAGDITVYEIRFQRGEIGEPGTFDINHKGKSGIIFATVYDIIKAFIKKRKPDMLMFSAAEASRVKLYDRMIKLMARDLKGRFDKEYDPSYGEVMYFLILTEKEI